MIEKLKNTFNIQNSIPTAYDDSLTFYEVLSKLMKKINECIDLVHGKQYPKVNELIDDRNNTIKTAINTNNDATASEFSSIISSYNENNKNLQTTFNLNHTALENVASNEKVVSDYASKVKDFQTSLLEYLESKNHVAMEEYDETTKTLYLIGDPSTLSKAPTIDNYKDVTPVKYTASTLEDYNKPENIVSTIEKLETDGD
jgi:hypothetical protein